MAQPARALYWSAIVADFRRSGLTHLEFCTRRRISIHSFRKWLYRLRPTPVAATATDQSNRDREPSPSSPPDFVPVHIRPDLSSGPGDARGLAAATPLELLLGDGRCIRVAAGFDPDALHQLLDVLERRP